jgi:hypothetical protein
MATRPKDKPKPPKRSPGTPRKIGRPTVLTPDVIDEICERVAGGEAIYMISDDFGFADSTIYRAMARDPVFATRIAQARASQQEYEADNIIRMADMATEEDHQVVKLRIWARQWRASKLAPKKYGDSTTLKHADADGEKIRSSIDPSLLSPEQRDMLRQLILASQQAQLPAPDGEYEEIDDEG